MAPSSLAERYAALPEAYTPKKAVMLISSKTVLWIKKRWTYLLGCFTRLAPLQTLYSIYTVWMSFWQARAEDENRRRAAARLL